MVTVAAEEDPNDADTTDSDTVEVSVTVLNVDEPGTVRLSGTVPTIDEELTAALSDPDGGLADIEWVWERSAGRSAWEVIDTATATTYTPTAADSEDYLRATATYTDSLGEGKTAQAVASSPTLAGLLSSLSITTSASRQMYPAFNSEILHYAVGCNTELTLSLSAADSDDRLSVNGIQYESQSAVVEVSGLKNGLSAGNDRPDASDIDIDIVVSGDDGESTTYVVHCIDDGYPEIDGKLYRSLRQRAV